MGGIVLADFVTLSLILLLIAALSLAVAAWFRPRSWLCWAATVAVFALLHTARYVESPARKFAATLDKPKSVHVEGVVWSEPVVFGADKGRLGATFWLRIEQAEVPSVIGQLCLARWQGQAPVYGDRVRMRGSAEVIAAPSNPGQFDVGKWLARQGVHFSVAALSTRECEVIGHGAGDPMQSFAIRSRAWIKERLDAGLPPDPRASTLISSMILGLSGETPPDLKELFQKTGTLHLFAVSGLNVGMLAIIAWYVLKPFGVGPRAGALIIVPMLVTYGVIVGMGASCARATVVGVFLLLAPLWNRDAVPMNSLAGAALAVLGTNTNELFNPGFQLSFVLVIVIVGLSRRIQRPMERWAEPDDFLPRKLWNWKHRAMMSFGKLTAEVAAVGIASWIGSLFFMWGYFHLLSPVALVANVPAIPLSFCILGLGVMSLAASALSLTSVAVMVNHANWQCAQWLIAWIGWIAQTPQGHYYLEWPALQRAPVCEVVALDAGDGAAIHVRTTAGDWLVDAGHARDYARFLLSYLRSRGVDRLDGLILTHGDAAHTGSAVELLDDFQPRWIADNPSLDRSGVHRTFHLQLAERSIGRRFLQRGDVIPLGGDATLRVLYPPADLPPQNVADEKSLVLRIETANGRVLLASDIGFTAEEWLLKHEPDLRADALVKGWAERDLSGTPDFIAAVHPRVIVCAARRNGEQAVEEWAAPFRERGIIVLSQAECGAVKIAIEQSGETRAWRWNAAQSPRLHSH